MLWRLLRGGDPAASWLLTHRAGPSGFRLLDFFDFAIYFFDFAVYCLDLAFFYLVLATECAARGLGSSAWRVGTGSPHFREGTGSPRLGA